MHTRASCATPNTCGHPRLLAQAWAASKVHTSPGSYTWRWSTHDLLHNKPRLLCASQGCAKGSSPPHLPPTPHAKESTRQARTCARMYAPSSCAPRALMVWLLNLSKFSICGGGVRVRGGGGGDGVGEWQALAPQAHVFARARKCSSAAPWQELLRSRTAPFVSTCEGGDESRVFGHMVTGLSHSPPTAHPPRCPASG